MAEKTKQIKLLATTPVNRKRTLCGSLLSLPESEANYLINIGKARDVKRNDKGELLDKNDPQETFVDGKDQTPSKGNTGAAA